MEQILIVDDDQDFRFNLSHILEKEGYAVMEVGDGKEALRVIKENPLDLVLLDLRLQNMNGMKILEKMKEMDSKLAILMLTGSADVKQAVKAMKLGAYDYITKPFDNEELILTIKKALENQSLSREVEVLRKRSGQNAAIDPMMGEGPQIKKVLRQLEMAAPTHLTVIIQGESGTGKELIAQLIHQKSTRKDKPLISIDCGAIPETLMESELFGYEKGAFTGAENLKEGKFEQANGGTLFLDEIANLPYGMQAKLLRVLQERKIVRLGGKKEITVDARIMAATQTDLAEAVRQGKFREDLFHRLNEFLIELPLLCERKEDISTLAKCFLEEANWELNKKIKAVSTEAMRMLLNYPWPGNIRELKNVIKKAVLAADSEVIGLEHILVNNSHCPKEPEFKYHLEEGRSLKEITREVTNKIEREIIQQALTKAGGNKSRAAKLLRIDRASLYSKIKELRPLKGSTV